MTRDEVIRRLARALGPDDGTLADVAVEVAQGRARLWLGEGAAFVTQEVSGPHGPELHVWLGGGVLQAVLALRPGLEAWARGAGFSAVTLEGRPGWTRALSRFGYRPRPGNPTILERVLQ